MWRKALGSILLIAALVVVYYTWVAPPSRDVGWGDFYICEEYIIDEPQFVFQDNKPVVSVRVIELVSEESEELNARVDKAIDILNRDINDLIFLETSREKLVLAGIKEKKLNYKNLLTLVHTVDNLDLLIVPSYARFTAEKNGGKVGGAALGVPEIDDPFKGKTAFFIRKEYCNTRVVTHEALHVLSLHHPFKDGPDESCVFGDRVSDTLSAEPGSSVSDRCDYEMEGSSLSVSEQYDVVSNVMSYSPPKCLREITQGQRERYRKMIESSPLIQATFIESIVDPFEE